MTLVSLSDAASRLKVPESTLRYWRHKGVGPTHYKVGRRVMYRPDDLDAFIESCRTDGSTR